MNLPYQTTKNMKDFSKKVSTNIRSMREAKRFTQGYMAKKLHISQQAYSQIEKNPEMITIKRLLEIADLLDESPATILGIGNDFVQQNFGQKGGQAATQLVQNYTTAEYNDIYERFISQLKEEVNYLRDELKNQLTKKLS